MVTRDKNLIRWSCTACGRMHCREIVPYIVDAAYEMSVQYKDDAEWDLSTTMGPPKVNILTMLNPIDMTCRRKDVTSP